MDPSQQSTSGCAVGREVARRDFRKIQSGPGSASGGGILSTDLYKVYSNNLLDRLTLAKDATKIGPIICVAPACADDVAVTADSSEIMQSLLDIGVDNSKMERFILQPVKSVILEILYELRRSATHRSKGWDLDGARMPTVDKTMHVGICRSADSDESAVTENIKKSQEDYVQPYVSWASWRKWP